jgi:hypothetical protein
MLPPQTLFSASSPSSASPFLIFAAGLAFFAASGCFFGFPGFFHMLRLLSYDQQAPEGGGYPHLNVTPYLVVRSHVILSLAKKVTAQTGCPILRRFEARVNFSGSARTRCSLEQAYAPSRLLRAWASGDGAAPPSTVMNSRGLIGLFPRPASQASKSSDVVQHSKIDLLRPLRVKTRSALQQ